MRQFLINHRVQLVEEVNELQLPRGEVGVVRGSWHGPNIAYEVEFRVSGSPLRLLLLDHQIAGVNSEYR
jgi:hypothetical protein